MAVLIEMWNADRPESVASHVAPDAPAAGQFIAGAIQSALDAGGTLVVRAQSASR